MTTLTFFLFYLLYPLFFIVPYFLMVVGLKIFKIKNISRGKIVFYLIILFSFGSFVSPLIKDALVEIFDNAILNYIINGLVSYALTLIVLRYYFKLTGRNLWMYFFYLIVIGIWLGLVIPYGLQLLLRP